MKNLFKRMMGIDKLEDEIESTDYMFYGLLGVLIIMGIIIIVYFRSSKYNKPGNPQNNMQLIQQQQQMLQNQNR